MTQSEVEPRLNAGYWRLWWATGINSVGDGAFAAAVPLLAVTVTHDPRLVSIVSAATYLPWLLLSLPAGAIVDRYDHVTLMWRAQASQAVIVSVIAVLVALGHIGIPALAIMTFGLGACAVVFTNAAQAVLPDLVAKPLLHKANGHQQTITTIGLQFAGPPLGSLLFAVAVALPFGLDAASFALSAALLATLPGRTRGRIGRTAGQIEHPPMRTAIADGVRWLARHRLLRTLAILLGVNTFCWQLGNVTLVLLATRTLGLDAPGYGLLLAGAALGSLLGGLVSARVIKKMGALPALLTALATNVVVFVGIGLSPNAIVLGVLLAVNGFLVTLWSIGTVGLRQHIVPSELLGRVNSVYRMLGWGLIPLGALAGGLVAHTFGLRAAYPVAGVLRGIALVVAMPMLIRALQHRPRRPATLVNDASNPQGRLLW
ncbi:MFS transporter [Nonomuraea jiangxiensis]|uniref:Transmembrane secretion effector n=1 Tax=Nonomuraea jiangxiensis TaxID=633440 RepID=A0A1G8JB83_9ACTN|nr:MFS transporter [Nonomuraea jiangxiensis]SDI27880.1 Transmembrane secretion effector [Nonomuraea jiangxiensis]